MDEGTVLVTGAAGLVGRPLVERLLAEGQRVVATDMRPPEGLDCPVVIADLNDVHRLYTAMMAHRIQAIVHCGGVSGSVVSVDNPHLIMRTNIGGTAHIFELARVFEVRRIVLCSSASVYGPQPTDPITEEIPLHPASVYGASKIAAEAILEAYAVQWRVDGVALRIFQVYGPGRSTDCQIRTMLMGAIMGRDVHLPYPATARRQYVHVDDVVEALVAALGGRDLPHRIYNISGNDSLTLREVAEVVARVVPGANIYFDATPTGQENQRGMVDISAAARDLVYTPKVSLEEGISTYAKWLRRAGARGPA